MDIKGLLIHLYKGYTTVWRKRFIFSKSLVCIWCLVFACCFVEYRVVAVFIDFLTDIWEKDSLWKAAILTNLQDGLSSLFVILTHLVEANTGHFSVIISGTAAYAMGLMLFWNYAWTYPQASISVPVAGILLVALGKAGQFALQAFLEHQIMVIVRARASVEVNQAVLDMSGSEEEENDHVVRVTIWWRSARLSGALLATVLPAEAYWYQTLKVTVLVMVSSYLIFFFGYIFYSFQQPIASPLTLITGVFKAAFWKLRFKFPRSLESYYWKTNCDYKQNQTYSSRRNGQIQLLPRVPHLWRWLDKAAIIREPHPPNPNPEVQEMKGDLCTVKQVREVKRFVSFIHLFLTISPYCMVVAAGYTYFVEQTTNMRLTFNVSGLFLFKTIARDMVLFLIWLLKSTNNNNNNNNNHKMTKVRIGFGMASAVFCCIVAFFVERQRLSLVKEHGVFHQPDIKVAMGIEILIPQFVLLGLMEALASNGLRRLFCIYAPESLWRFEDPFIEFVFGVGKLLTIPCVYSITGWFKESMNTSHIDRYYLMLAGLNVLFIFVYAYFSTKYKEDLLEAEELGMDEMPNIIPSEHGQQSDQAEAVGIVRDIANRLFSEFLNMIQT